MTERLRTELTGAADAVSVVECQDLSAGYAGVAVVQAVSLHCGRGEILAIIGPNGSGKSTLLKRLAGLLPDMGGRVRLAGDDVTSMPTQELRPRPTGTPLRTSNSRHLSITYRA